jgi:crotonobetainyl-CoA:carnitine CoA-transferase CaiB-like acyl-CoA transferase
MKQRPKKQATGKSASRVTGLRASGKTAAFAELMAVRPDGGSPLASGEVDIAGSDPFHKTPFRVGETVAAVLAAIGVALNDVWEIRTSRRQRITIDVSHAAASLQTLRYSQRRTASGGYERIPVPDDMALQWALSIPWPAQNGRSFLPHFNLPHLQRRVLDVLDCAPSKSAVAKAVASWDALELEEAIAGVRACGGTVRSAAEWRAHPQGQALAAVPIVDIVPQGEGPQRDFGQGARPLTGLRVLDLTRILAGPIAGRVLAEHGADVLMVTAPHLPQTMENVRDTSHGKRSCFLDFRKAEDLAAFRTLLASADIVLDGYRPGALASHGLDATTLEKRHPGLIHISINCFGSTGPFKDRAGWEQVAQAVTGICQTQGEMTGNGQPMLVPVAMCDYLTGYLGAYGAILALAARARDRRGRHVQVSLCRSAMFIQAQGLLPDWAAAPERLDDAELDRIYVKSESVYGPLRTLGPVLRLSETPGHWALPTPPLGSHPPVWT